MITIELWDSFEQELELGDVIIIHFPNPQMKIIGELVFDSTDCEFKLSFGKNGCECFKHTHATFYEKICHIYRNEKLKDAFGRIVMFPGDTIEHVYEMAGTPGRVEIDYKKFTKRAVL